MHGGGPSPSGSSFFHSYGFAAVSKDHTSLRGRFPADPNRENHEPRWASGHPLAHQAVACPTPLAAVSKDHTSLRGCFPAESGKATHEPRWASGHPLAHQAVACPTPWQPCPRTTRRSEASSLQSQAKRPMNQGCRLGAHNAPPRHPLPHPSLSVAPAAVVCM